MILSWRRVGRLLWSVPVVMALRQMGPDGVQPAEACSGGVPGAGWGSLRVADAYPETRVPIATDGFVLFEAIKIGEGFSLEDGDVTIKVTDEQNVEIAGQLEILSGHTDTQSDVSQFLLGWQAEEPLELGAELQLSWSAGDLAEQSLALDVVGEPPPLPTPTAVIDAWVDVRHGVGDVSSCGNDTPCESSSFVHSSEVKLRGVLTSWDVPELTGMVAWAVRSEVSDPRDQGEGPVDRPSVVSRYVASRPTVSAGLVTFADETVDHCVVLIVKDLRTGEEVRSEPKCGEPAEPALMRADHDLRLCAEPPTPESVELWCEGRRDPPEICDGTTSGEGGEAGGGGDGEIGAGGHRDVPKPRGGTSGSDGGCHLARTDGAWGSALLVLAALLSGVARRRRAAARG
jgi:hypothetical protein